MNLTYFLHLFLAFVNRFKLIIILSIVLGIVAFFLFRFLLPLIFGSKIEKVGVVGRYTPDTLPKYILSLVGSGLTKINDSGFPEPGLASSWETKDKGKTWDFKLKDGLTWQDGKKVVASDISYKFSDAQISYPDDKTVRFTLQNAFSPFPSVVSTPVFKKGLLGTGDWKVTNASVLGSFIDQLVLVNKNKERKILKFYPSEDRAKLAFKLGEVDEISEVFTAQPFESWKTVKLSERDNTGRVVAIFFNSKDPNLSEKTLRQALAYASKKDGFPGERAISPLSPASWAYNSQVKPYDYDIKRAKELLDDLPDKTRKNLSITLTTSQILLPEAEKIAENWKELGIKTEVKGFSGIPTDYQAFMAIFDIPEDPDQYSFWHSSQTSTNISKFSNPKIDKLLEDGRTELNFEERKKIYLDFQRFLVEDSPVIFLYHPVTYKVERK